jgi:hypothetical protein
MKIWKVIPSLLLVLSLGACASTSSDDNVPENALAPAPANTPAANPTVSAAPTATAPATRKADPPAPRIEMVTIPAESEVTVILSNSLNSGRNQAGDEFEGGLAAPLSANGKTVIERGTKVLGKVVDADGSGRVKGVANMRLTLTGIQYNGKIIPITTQTHFAEAEATKGRDAAVVGGGAGLGAAIGAIAGGKKGAATGAIIGGAAGTGTVLATKGKEVDFPAESKITFTLAEDLTVRR